MKPKVAELYRLRFKKELKSRNLIWKTLCKDFFQKYIKQSYCVCDLVAGYCEFINNINAKKKYAIDINPDTKKYAASNVKTLICSSTNLPKYINSKMDIVFVSNFFEHLSTKEDLTKTLIEIKKIIKKNGKLIILMPNLRLVGAAYWDFLDHQLPLTDISMIEALELNGFKIIEAKDKFLPYSTKSKLPKNPFFVSLYLKLGPLQFMFGKQSLIIATKNNK